MRNFHRPVSGPDWSGAVKWLMIANGACYVAQQFAPGFFIQNLGLVPYDVLTRHAYWQPLTYFFLHGGVFHLLFNMLALWMFGKPLEAQWGTREFLKYYFLMGIAAGLFTILVAPGSRVPSIGASGAIYALLIGFAMMYPDTTVYLYFLVPVTAKQMVILFAGVELLTSLSSNPYQGGVAVFAHLGGMVAGFLYLRYWQEFKIRLKNRFRGFGASSARKAPKFTVHEPEDLSREVDRILDKILLKGAASLTEEEQETMRRFSKKNK